MTDLRTFAQAQLETSKKMVSKTQELMPTLIAEKSDGSLVICAVPEYGNPQTKQLCQMMLKSILAKEGATRYAFTMEAWMGTTASKTLPPGYLPSKDPNRKEAIVVAAADRKGGTHLLVAFIDRSGDEVKFEDPEEPPTGMMGALFSLFGESMH